MSTAFKLGFLTACAVGVIVVVKETLFDGEEEVKKD